MSADVLTALTREEAERLTERVRLTATTFMEARDKLAELLEQAREGRVWEALEMRSLEEWTQATFSDTPLMRLTRDERRVIVSDLAEQGMSSRAIAPVVGSSFKTVARDIESVSTDTDAPRTVKSVDGVERTFQPKENAVTDLANGTRNDVRMFADTYRQYLTALGKNLPKENLPAAAAEHIIKALRDGLAEVEEHTNRAIAQIEGEQS